MVVYELTHMFFRYENELEYSPKNLGLYCSLDDLKDAIAYYSMQPGFCDNQDAFSIQEKSITGRVVNNAVFEVIVYIHSKDYEIEIEIPLGLYGNEEDAQNELRKYCTNNVSFMNAQGLISEMIINRCVLGKKEWAEGFLVCKAE